MKIPVASIGEITRLVAVICQNPHKLHKGVYVRYLIMMDAEMHAVFLDDPDYKMCQEMTKKVASRADCEVVTSLCQFCQAQQQKLLKDGKNL
jgi:hypothetical protein